MPIPPSPCRRTRLDHRHPRRHRDRHAQRTANRLKARTLTSITLTLIAHSAIPVSRLQRWWRHPLDSPSAIRHPAFAHSRSALSRSTHPRSAVFAIRPTRDLRSAVDQPRPRQSPSIPLAVRTPSAE
jgi:hypothetical protein